MCLGCFLLVLLVWLLEEDIWPPGSESFVRGLLAGLLNDGTATRHTDCVPRTLSSSVVVNHSGAPAAQTISNNEDKR